ncbi:MAG: FAD-binding oxidoreductase, partial [Burkholderiales bacterium]|nr:FAD-binding oxidoreductase [Burkholderiales bacterium]
MLLRELDDRLARDSYYAATAPRAEPYPALLGSASCDVAVVGGGLAGLSAALELAERGRDVRLLEAGTLGSGASG